MRIIALGPVGALALAISSMILTTPPAFADQNCRHGSSLLYVGYGRRFDHNDNQHGCYRNTPHGSIHTENY